MTSKRTAPQGIRVRHSTNCGSRAHRGCNCSPSYEAWVWDGRSKRKLYRTFPSMAAAKSWRSDSQAGLRRGVVDARSKETLKDVGDAFLAGVRAGTIWNRSGGRYKPSAIRGYEQALRLRLYPAFGTVRLSELRRADVQTFVRQLVADGLTASTVRNTVTPLQAIYRHAIQQDLVARDPTVGLELPAVTGSRERIADPEEAVKLLAALPERDRAVWATAMYAGLRLGELRALEWSHVNLDRNVIRVEKSWDKIEGTIAPKSKAGVRSVPIHRTLREYLIAHRLRTGRGTGYVFAVKPGKVFSNEALQSRADEAWTTAKLNRITLHECRHTFASMMIAAGVNAKTLQVYMGHSSITTTLDRYGKLFPGNAAETVALMDTYLDAAGEGAS